MLGIVAMAGLLFYDGSQRINVTVILAFVLLQLALALATTLQAVIGWQPWRWLGRRLRLPDAPPVHARLRPLFMARAAQAGGTAFALSALATLLILVVVEDLAFGWSSTLTLASDRYLALVRALASPWGWLWPQAVPTRELVEGTRFFRAGPGPEATDPALWGQWWPFVTLLWCTWVLLPRLSLLVFSHWLLRWRASGLLARHPARQALLRRMANPTIDSGHDQAGDGLLPEPPAAVAPGRCRQATWPLPGPARRNPGCLRPWPGWTDATTVPAAAPRWPRTTLSWPRSAPDWTWPRRPPC